jgi:ribosomal protein S18 acetylase RimI-like enzyme
MMQREKFKIIPWDSAAFGICAYECDEVNPETLRAAAQAKGHYTVRIDPLASKQTLYDYGFYYCDTLIEPYCTVEDFVFFDLLDAQVSESVKLDSLLAICQGAFSHGRFHRDFNISQARANQRYNNWLAELHADGKVRGLTYQEQLAGFIAVDGSKLVLHALSESLRGLGLAKYLWTPVCRTLFEEGFEEVTSSVSATNLAVVNLYSRLGFRFRNPVDIYHRYTK